MAVSYIRPAISVPELHFSIEELWTGLYVIENNRKKKLYQKGIFATVATKMSWGITGTVSGIYGFTGEVFISNNMFDVAPLPWVEYLNPNVLCQLGVSRSYNNGNLMLYGLRSNSGVSDKIKATLYYTKD